MERKIKTLIIDDEKPARDLIVHYLADHSDFDVIGQVENGFEALKIIQERHPDLLFLDIQMPKISGLELFELLEKPYPSVIFSTAFDQYAIDAFELNALDYLLKPFDKKRFNQAVEKMLVLYQSGDAQKESLDLGKKISNIPFVLEKIVVKSGYKIHIIPMEDIFYLEAQDDYVKIYSNKGNFLKQQTMKYFDDRVPENKFIRIHRSYIVNLDKLGRIEVVDKNNSLAVLQGDVKLPISKSGMELLKQQFDF